MKLNQYILTRSGQAENGYGSFIDEILHSEGLMGFKPIDLDMEKMPNFNSCDIIVVTRCFLRKDEINRILKAAEEGVGVVLIQPSLKFAKQLGLEPACKIIHPGYVRFYVDGRLTYLQTHVPIDIYTACEDWQIIADACDENFESLGNPAIVSKAFKKGVIAVYGFDLPKAIARIRFGNPDRMSLATSGYPWPHANDLFVEHVDNRLSWLPQADIHAQIFAEVITNVCAYPLPRIWYYENIEQSSACVFQSDDDFSTLGQFDALSAALEKRGGTATFYLMPVATNLSEEKVAIMRKKGHTFGPHVDATISIRDPQLDDLYFEFPEKLQNDTENFKNRFGICSATIQSHYAPWMGYMDWVPKHIKHGYRMLFANLGLRQTQWGGFMCGSSRPMKYFDVGCATHYDCWQQPVIFYDDSSIVEWIKNFDGPTEIFDNFFDAAIHDNHSIVSCLSHPVSFATYSQPVMEHIMDRVIENGISICNGDEWLAFNDHRNNVTPIHELDGENCIKYRVENFKGRLAVMIPDGEKQITLNDHHVKVVSQNLFRQKYLGIQLDDSIDGYAPEIRICSKSHKLS